MATRYMLDKAGLPIAHCAERALTANIPLISRPGCTLGAAG